MKKSYLVGLLIVLIAHHLGAQPFSIGHSSVTLIDPDRGNRQIPTELYYPADVAGNDVPVTLQTLEQFPLLVFGHGFMMAWSAYENIWSTLVPLGYVMAFPTTEGTLSPNHDAFGKDLAFVVKAVSALSGDASSPFYQRIGSMNCVMGHSMGGGGAFLAAAGEPIIKAIATLAPAETTPSAKAAAAGINIPALIFAGGNDCVTPPPAHQVPIYDSLASTCKTYISITGGSHCQMAEYNFYCSLGESTCTPPPAISRPQQHIVINRYLIPWLTFFLKGDASAGALFDQTLQGDPEILATKNCSLFTGIQHEDPAVTFTITVYPNPFDGLIKIDLPENISGTFSLFDPVLRKIKEQQIRGSATINLSEPSSGLLIYTFKSSTGTMVTGKIIKR
jgi:pimeloyl-ACP methyl ester carboxylesterase